MLVSSMVGATDVFGIQDSSLWRRAISACSERISMTKEGCKSGLRKSEN